MTLKPNTQHVLLGLTFLALLSAQANAQQKGGNSSPSDWRKLPPAEAVKYLKQFYDPVEDKLIGNIDEEEVRTFAAKMIPKIDFTSSYLNYATLDSIHWAADPKLNDNQQEQIRKALLSRQDDWHGKPYSEIKGKSMLMRRLKLPMQLRIHEGRCWALAGGKQSDVPAKDTPEAGQYFVDEEASRINGSLTVRWEGQLTPPKTGSYRFSFSPINVNSDDSEYPIKVSMSVAINGQLVVSADAANWTTTSAPVSLTGDKPVSFRADFAAQVKQMPRHALHACLYWEGPGLDKALVPATYLSPPDSKDEGLRGTYTWSENGAKKSVTRTDQTIDFAWTAAPISLFANSREIDEINNLYWDQTTSAEFLGWCENHGGKPRLHPFFQDPDAVAAGSTSDRRAALLNQLRAQPLLLDPLNAKQMVMFYGAFRFGAPDLALSVFVKWAERHADLECELPRATTFEAETRQALRRMAIYVCRETPNQAQVLEHDFLKLPDGRCCLPVAYTLAIAHLAKGNLGEWTKSLDHILADAKLTGDLRVNWLLARAFAEEIRQAGPRVEPYEELYIRPTDGTQFLYEAIRVAQEGQTIVRLAKERAGRLVGLGKVDEALEALATVEDFVTDEDQKASLAAWKEQLKGLKQGHASRIVNNTNAAQQAYVDELERRRNAAARAKDSDEVKRYEALIKQAKKAL